MAESITDKLVHALFPKDCFDQLLVKFNFTNFGCLILVLAKILGYYAIYNALLSKIPQIKKITDSKSGQGVSLFAQATEVFSFTVALGYAYSKGFAITQWGASAIQDTQTVVICMLILYYNGNTVGTGLLLVAYVIGAVAIVQNLIPVAIWKVGVSLSLPLVVSGRLTQIWSIYQTKSTGKLSSAMLKRQFISISIKLFITVVETADVLLTAKSAILLCTMVVLLYQMRIFGPKEDGKKKN